MSSSPFRNLGFLIPTNDTRFFLVNKIHHREDEVMEESVPSIPPESWRYPFFGTIVGTIRSHLEVDRSSKIPGSDTTVYALEEGFVPNDRLWIDFIQPDRMNRESDVLYRPHIVYNLVQRIERLYTRRLMEGLMIKGPQGVGKSYTLINLTRYLLASGKYLVTVIPDCEYWRDENDFFAFLLRSVGVDPNHFDLDYDATVDQKFKKIIHDIDKLLRDKGMRWVFVFDQINRIFARKEFETTRDVGVIEFPFEMMKRVIKPGRIISIISASANNHVSYRENHPGFEQFDHPIQLNNDEISILYASEQQQSWLEKWDELEYATGRVPWYLNQWAQGFTGYLGEVKLEIGSSLDKLHHEPHTNWDCIVDSAIKCVLKLSSSETLPPLHFDRKYSVLHRENEEIHIVALFRFIEAVYRDYFWNEIMNYTSREGANLLRTCSNPSTAQDVRGRLFEQIVIWRLAPSGLSPFDLYKILNAATIDTETDDIKAAFAGKFSVQRFDSKVVYPALPSLQNKIILFIPRVMPHFPAVDMIFLRVGNIVITFHIHTSENHKNVLPLLQHNVEKAQWKHEGIHTVVLVYLSPHPLITRTLKRKHESISQTSSSSMAQPTNTNMRYVLLYYSSEDFQDLHDIPWLIV